MKKRSVVGETEPKRKGSHMTNQKKKQKSTGSRSQRDEAQRSKVQRKRKRKNSNKKEVENNLSTGPSKANTIPRPSRGVELGLNC